MGFGINGTVFFFKRSTYMYIHSYQQKINGNKNGNRNSLHHIAWANCQVLLETFAQDLGFPTAVESIYSFGPVSSKRIWKFGYSTVLLHANLTYRAYIGSIVSPARPIQINTNSICLLNVSRCGNSCVEGVPHIPTTLTSKNISKYRKRRNGYRTIHYKFQLCRVTTTQLQLKKQSCHNEATNSFKFFKKKKTISYEEGVSAILVGSRLV